MSFSHPLYILLHLSGFAFAMSLAVCGFMISAGVLDVPVSRSNHKQIVPTAAGVGIVAGLGVGLLALSLFYPGLGDGHLMGELAALALGVGVLGLFDDLYEMGSKTKFFFLILLSCACVYVIGAPAVFPLAVVDIPLPILLGFGGAVLWIFVVSNAVNFMDGVNGILGCVMCVAFAGLGVVCIGVGALTPALLSVLMAGSLCGFVPYNARMHAHIFSGDVGALFCGFMFAACSLMLAIEKPELGLLYVGPLLILPFLTDVFLTLLVRARHKKSLLSAHSEHMYQRYARSGRSHMQTTLLYIIASVLMCFVVFAGVQYGMIRSVFFFMVWVCVLSGIYIFMYKKLEANAPDPQHRPPNL